MPALARDQTHPDRSASWPNARNTVFRRHPGRVIIALVCIAAVAGFIYALATNPNLSWGAVAYYIFYPKILSGVAVTLILSIVSTVVGLAIGVVLAVMRLSQNAVARALSGAYIWFFRGTPVLVQLIFWFNLAFLFPTLTLAIPFTNIGVQWNTNDVMTGFNAALLGLGLNLGAYAAEIVRAGIQAVNPGQSEAGNSLGMTSGQRLRLVVLPQAIRIIIPPFGNEFIGMLKTTSLVYVIAGNDLMTNASQIYKQNSEIMELLIVASLWYMLMTAVATYFQGKIERRFGGGTGISDGARKQSIARGGDFWRSLTGTVRVIPGELK